MQCPRQALVFVPRADSRSWDGCDQTKFPIGLSRGNSISNAEDKPLPKRHKSNPAPRMRQLIEESRKASIVASLSNLPLSLFPELCLVVHSDRLESRNRAATRMRVGQPVSCSHLSPIPLRPWSDNPAVEWDLPLPCQNLSLFRGPCGFFGAIARRTDRFAHDQIWLDGDLSRAGRLRLNPLQQ